MPEVVGIQFKRCGKVYDFDANELALRKGDRIIIDSEFGLSIGTVVEPPHAPSSQPKDLKKVLRVAAPEDFRQQADNQKFEQEAKCFCYERVMARGLPMKLVRAEATLDRKKIVFYFTADGRVDFRELVKDLAARFKTRIEMRQIGVRDKAKLVGGFGLCGQELCCRTFLANFEPISIKMAKQQDLTLNMGKLSGACGRLMCCLGYEYQEGAPPAGREEAPQPAKSRQREEPRRQPERKAEKIEPPPAAEAAAEAEVPQSGEAAEQTPGSGQKRRRRRRNRKKAPKSE